MGSFDASNALSTLTASANDVIDNLATAIAEHSPNSNVSPEALGRVLSKANAAIAGVLEIPEIAEAHQNGQNIGPEITGAAGAVMGGYIGAELGLLAGAAIAGAIGAVGLPAGLLTFAFGAGLALAGSLLYEELFEDLVDLFTEVIDPLVFDLDGDGVELTALATSNAFFDLDGDGFAERTGWVSSDDALLAMDRNGNGSIDGIFEVFGSQSQTGYQELAELDENSDGVIDVQDASFSDLLLWQDANGDGKSDAGELNTLASHGIAEISLNASPANQWIAGNQVIETASFTFADGTIGHTAEVLFSLEQLASKFVIPNGFIYDDDAFALPYLRGFGDIANSWVAMGLVAQIGRGIHCVNPV